MINHSKANRMINSEIRKQKLQLPNNFNAVDVNLINHSKANRMINSEIRKQKLQLPNNFNAVEGSLYSVDVE